MEGLPGRREYLGTFLGSHSSLEDGQHLPQRPSGEANSNISTSGLCSAYGQANNLASRKAEAKATNITR